MSDLEDDYFFNCPCCMEQIYVSVDRTGGRRQAFTQDCEVCCQPISVRIQIDRDGGVSFQVTSEA